MFGAINFAVCRQQVMRNNFGSVLNSCKQFIDHDQKSNQEYMRHEEKSLHLSLKARMLFYPFYLHFVWLRSHRERAPRLAFAYKYLLMFNYVRATITTTGSKHVVEKLEGS